MKVTIVILSIFISLVKTQAQQVFTTDVLVVNAGTGGTAAAIQSARTGAKTILIEPTPWLGGMLSAAGVTATDGNNRLASGIWNEFREALYKHYGTRNLMTGWVSNTQFEPYVADSIFKSMAKKEKKLTIFYGYHFLKVIKQNNNIKGAIFSNDNGKTLTVKAAVTIDATDLGDVLANAGAAFNVGMEANTLTQENVGIEKSNNIIQDLTYAAILKDYGKGVDKTIPKPAKYNPLEFDGACTDYFIDTTMKEKPNVTAQKMLDYGKLPNNKYMINWPKKGNDTYLNIINLSLKERAKALEIAKQTTYRFIYFIQTQLGFKNLGIADDEFDSKDKMPYIAYHREGRRVKGLVRFTMRNIAEPYTYGKPLYRTGISVGDYPIDHHHKKNSEAPQHLNFYPIPSYNIPFGAVVPEKINGLLVCDKSISVSNIINGSTRLQPVVLLTGQAVGALAALSASQKIHPKSISIRTLQNELLKNKMYIMPFIDISPTDSCFAAVQRVGATGILKGKGIPYQWANQTWFYGDSSITESTLHKGLQEFNPSFSTGVSSSNTQFVSVQQAAKIITDIIQKNPTAGIAYQQEKSRLESLILKDINQLQNKLNITRKTLAYVIDKYINPFQLQSIDYNGEFISKTKTKQ